MHFELYDFYQMTGQDQQACSKRFEDAVETCPRIGFIGQGEGQKTLICKEDLLAAWRRKWGI